LYSAPSFFKQETKTTMPYFQVRVSRSYSKDMLIEASDRIEAGELAVAAMAFDADVESAAGEPPKRVILLAHDSNESIDTARADKADWTTALKTQRSE